MDRLRVTPSRHHTHDRLYVHRPDGTTLAWYDRDTAHVSLLNSTQREAVLDSLTPFLTGPVTVGPPPAPTPADLARLALHPDDDLAPNRPGEALLVALDRAPARPSRLRPSRLRPTGFRPDPRRHALTAEQTVGDTLDALAGAGWHVLHSLPLPGGDRIHHLAIGPGGLLCVHALYAHGQRVLVADPMVTTGRREAAPLLRRLRADAHRASYALTAEVTPLLAVVAPSRLEITAAPRDGLRVLRDADLSGALTRLGGVLKPADAESLYAMARDRHTWTRL
ncbi:nuclease-related domain-containing protein [Streptomyces sp. B3I7]|uniref:nuclease-related domain-containing protein n=1 Tax=Streptomyces sp. B3I7 TaxID=3042269 RepID=UPI0027D85ACC|nr:nuclease-related domain-containing protein [Streptomyces sp. B3I7]